MSWADFLLLIERSERDVWSCRSVFLCHSDAEFKCFLILESLEFCWPETAARSEKEKYFHLCSSIWAWTRSICFEPKSITCQAFFLPSSFISGQIAQYLLTGAEHSNYTFESLSEFTFLKRLNLEKLRVKLIFAGREPECVNLPVTFLRPSGVFCFSFGWPEQMRRFRAEQFKFRSFRLESRIVSHRSPEPNDRVVFIDLCSFGCSQSERNWEAKNSRQNKWPQRDWGLSWGDIAALICVQIELIGIG